MSDKEQTLGPIMRKDGYEFMYFLSKVWLKVFYHKYTGNVFFESEEEALLTNSKQKYSILSLIGNTSKINDKYEFILYWPDENEYVHWKQSNNPIDENETKEKTAQGFELKYIPQGSVDFGGLVRTTIPFNSEKPTTHLDGNPGQG